MLWLSISLQETGKSVVVIYPLAKHLDFDGVLVGNEQIALGVLSELNLSVAQ